MAISAIYTVLNRIIRKEIEAGKKIAVFPMGKVGTLAQYIIESKYACKGIYIDNIRCKDTAGIISFKEYKGLDEDNISIILTTNNITLNRLLCEEIQQAGIKAGVINVLKNYDNGTEEYLERIRDLCRVKKAEGYQMIRIGAKHDGGYVMLDDFKGKNTAYSVGIGTEISWDLDMVQRGFQVYCFDHTIQSLPAANKNLHFIKYGLDGVAGSVDGLLTLDTMLDLNNHSEKNKMILKIDIEGAEWAFLREVSSDILNRFSQITMELHNLINADYYERIVAGLENINKTHQAVWIHANCGGGVQDYGRISMPNLLEATFANRSEYAFTPIEYHCPIALDSPNSGEEDIVLDGWGSA